MGTKETRTQLVARYARWKLATDLLDYIGEAGKRPEVVLAKITATLQRIAKEDGEGF